MKKDTDVDMKRSISTLLFFSFGFDLDDLEKEESDPIDHLIDKAYIDATNQGAFNTQTKNQKDERNAAKDNARSYLRKRIHESLSQIYTKEAFDAWHEKTCNGLINQYKKEFEGIFTYGNAQKWINMILKYADMLIPFYHEPKRNMPDWMKIVEKYHGYLHAPVDSYVIEAVWENLDEKNEGLLPLNKEKRLKNNSWGKYSSEKVKGWSSWDRDEYLNFRKMIDSIIKDIPKEAPIEWEAREWIRIAKERKK